MHDRVAWALRVIVNLWEFFYDTHFVILDEGRYAKRPRLVAPTPRGPGSGKPGTIRWSAESL